MAVFEAASVAVEYQAHPNGPKVSYRVAKVNRLWRRYAVVCLVDDNPPLVMVRTWRFHTADRTLFVLGWALQNMFRSEQCEQRALRRRLAAMTKIFMDHGLEAPAPEPADAKPEGEPCEP